MEKQPQFIKDFSKNSLEAISKDVFPKENNDLLNAFGLNPKKLVYYFNNLPDSNKIYFSHIGTLLNYIILSGHSPSIFIYKKPLEDELFFELFNPQLEAIYYKKSCEDYRNEVILNLAHYSVFNIPVRPLFEKFFEKDYGTISKVLTQLNLTEKEQILYDILKENNWRLEQEKIPIDYVNSYFEKEYANA